MKQSSTAVIVEDDAVIAIELEMMCKTIGVEVLGIARTADDADELLQGAKPDFVLMDVRLGGARDGIDVAESFAPGSPDSKIIYITASSEPATMDRIHEDHPYRILIKPIGVDELRAAVA